MSQPFLKNIRHPVTVYTQFCWGKSRGEVLHNMVDLPHSKPPGSRSGSGGEKLNLIWYAQNIFRESRHKERSLIAKMVKVMHRKLKIIMSNGIALVFFTDPSSEHTGRTKRSCRQSKFTTPHNSPFIAESHACSHRTTVALVKGSKHPGKPSVFLWLQLTSVFVWVINFFSHSLRSLSSNHGSSLLWLPIVGNILLG